jgi:hypothetical protein
MTGFLASVSFDSGSRPDDDAIGNLSIDEAFWSTRRRNTRHHGRRRVYRLRVRQVDAGELTSFVAVELSAPTTVFGHVAHRVSTYSKTGAASSGPIDARGVILTSSGAFRWRISPMVWDDARPGLEESDLRSY